MKNIIALIVFFLAFNLGYGQCANPTVTWNGGWTPNAPNINTPVIINGTYITDAINGSFSACNLTVNGVLIIDNNYFVEVENNVIIDGGTITVETQGAFIQNGIAAAAGTFTLQNLGIAEVNKTTADYFDDGLHYTYWSSPVVGADIVTVFPNPDDNRRFFFNAQSFIDTDGDDIDDDSNDWRVATGIMGKAVGYAVTAVPPPAVPNPFPYSGTAQFSGEFYTGDVPVTIYRNDTSITDNNWNLIGNPYPSAISTDEFFLENAYINSANATVPFPENTNGTIDAIIYLWTHISTASAANAGNEVFNFSQDDYAIINLTGGIAPVNDITKIPNKFIPSGQAFFVVFSDDATTTGGANPVFSNTVMFNNAMRIADATSNSQFFRVSNSKKESNDMANKLWVNLSSDNGVFNQILTAYLDGATDGNDGMSYDAPKNLSTGAAAILYTIIEGNNKKFAIQGKAENSLNVDEVISIGFKTAIDIPTIYTLSIAQLEGDFLNGNPIYLKDNFLNTLHNLKDSDYNFTSTVGEFNERFEIVFNQDALSLGDQAITNNDLSIIELRNGDVQFKLSGNLAMSSIQIIDLQGRVLYDLKVEGNNKTYNLSNLSQSVYIANVTLSNGTTIAKKAVKRF